MLPPFVKIMQRFILMQKTKKKDWIGGVEFFYALFFQKSALFGQYLMLFKFFRLGPDNVKTNLTQAVSETCSYLCTNNICISY